jgi:hypothetical protein
MVLLIIIPIKWLFHWEYTLFSDKPICCKYVTGECLWGHIHHIPSINGITDVGRLYQSTSIYINLLTLRSSWWDDPGLDSSNLVVGCCGVIWNYERIRSGGTGIDSPSHAEPWTLLRFLLKGLAKSLQLGRAEVAQLLSQLPLLSITGSWKCLEEVPHRV